MLNVSATPAILYVCIIIESMSLKNKGTILF